MTSKMPRILSLFTTTSIASFATAHVNDVVFTQAILPAFAVGAAVTAIWTLGRQLAFHALKPTDVQWMSHGVCPVCQAQGSITEVTSHIDGHLVECMNCRENFDVRPGASYKDSIVVRLGKPVPMEKADDEDANG